MFLRDFLEEDRMRMEAEIEAEREKKRPILCVDFDGVIHAYTSGWQGANVVADGPVPGAMRFLHDATMHFRVYIYSSRSSQRGGERAMREAIIRWRDERAEEEGLSSNFMPALTFCHEKPPAFLTIDDRALCFDGTFPDAESLLAFKPWNKRDV